MTITEGFKKFIEWRGFNRKTRTINGYIGHLTHFCIYLRDPELDVETVDFDDCLNWLGLMQKLNFDQNTLQKKAIAIKLFFDFLQRKGFKVVEPELIPIPQKIFRFPRVATEAQYQKLLSVIPEQGKYRPLYWHIRNKAIIMLLHDTGARNGEIASLDLDDIDVSRMAARIKTEKSRGTIPFREIFWRTEANEALKKWLERFSGVRKRTRRSKNGSKQGKSSRKK